MRLPAGEGILTRLNRCERLIKELEAGIMPSKRAIARALVEYHSLLSNIWLWQVKKQ